MAAMALTFSACQSSQSEKKENIIIPTPTGVPSVTVNQNPSGQRPANNPAHGQPFHDCALPVGAAFAAENSSAQPKAITVPTNVRQEVQQHAEPVKKEVKLNPAHGQPGHKCEVAVGAPLS